MSPLRHTHFLALALALLTLPLLLGACEKGGEAPPKSAGEHLSSPLDEPMERAAPIFNWERADGTHGRLDADDEGAPVLVHFWATWCAPCVDELPALLAFAREEPRLRLLAISLDPHWKAVRDFFPEGVPPEVVRAQVNTDAAYRVSSLPETFVVDGDGTIRLRIEGEREWADPQVRRAIRLQAGLE